MKDLEPELQAEVEVLCASLKNKEILEQVVTRLKSYHFRNDLTKWFYNIVLVYYNEYKEVVPEKIVYHQIRKGEKKKRIARTEFVNELLELSSSFKKEDISNVEYWINYIIAIKKHCDQCSFVEALTEHIAKMDVKSFDNEIARYEKDFANSKIEIPDDHASSAQNRLSIIQNEDKIIEQSIRLGLKDGTNDIDELLDNLLIPRQGALISTIGATGVGKSTFHVHVGVKAVFQGFNVLDIPLEGNADYIKAQYDARISGVKTKDIFQKRISREERELISKKWSRTKGKLWILNLRSNHHTFGDLIDLKNQIEKKEKRTVDVVIIRPIHKLVPMSKVGSKDEGLRAPKVLLYKEGVSFFQEGNKCLLFVEDHAKTVSWYNKDYTKDDIAEAPGVSSELDFLIGIPQTKGEHKLRRARIQLIKTRVGNGEGKQIKVKQEFDKSKFVGGW